MAFESDIIKSCELKIGDIYKMEVLETYVSDNNSILIIPNCIPHLPPPYDDEEYKVKEIINNCGTAKHEGSNIMQESFDSAVILEKVNK